MWKLPFNPTPINPPGPQLPEQSHVHHTHPHEPELPPRYGYIHPDVIAREKREEEECWQDHWKYPFLAFCSMVLYAVLPAYCAFRIITENGWLMIIPPFCLAFLAAPGLQLLPWALIGVVVSEVLKRISKGPVVDWISKAHFYHLLLGGIAGSCLGVIAGLLWLIFGK